MKGQAYPRYKSSGVEWLGDVPEHWNILPLKWHAVCFSGDSLRADEVSTTLQRDADTPVIGGNGLLGYSNRANIGEPVLVIGRVGALCGNVHRVSPPAWITDNALVLKADRRIFDHAYLLRTLVSRNLNELAEKTAQPLITGSQVRDQRLPVPPLSEQIAIAGYLEREAGRIDRLVAKKRELIERLKEKRTALISRAVTRGLPASEAAAAGLAANPTLKASGVEWLGDVLEHWEIKQLKWAIMFQRGHDFPSDEREEGTIPLVTSAGISAFVSKAAARGPGIVTGRYGTIGEFYLIEEDYWPLNTTLYSIELRENHPAFLRYMLMHLAPLFLLNAVKSAVPGVDRNDIHPTTAALPPPAEQVAIAAFLDKQTAKLDALEAKVQEAIERLQEYRIALITAAVTGKIDVRKAAA